jgi:hypothetical protein
VTNVDSFLFNYFKNTLLKVEIDSPITINSSLMYYMSKIEELTLGENVSFIDENSFKSTFTGVGPISTLKSLSIYSKTSIPRDFLNGAPKLETLILGPNIKSLGLGFCFKCSALKSITISEGPTIIPNGAFLGISGIQSIVIPKSIQFIEIDAFNNSSTFTDYFNVFYPGTQAEWSLISIGSGNSYLKNSIKNYNSTVNKIKYIETAEMSYIETNTNEIWQFSLLGESIFNYNFANFIDSTVKSIYKFHTFIKEVTLPDTIEIIHKGAFNGCKQLIKINIPNRVRYIGSYAFNDVINLEKIYLPLSVTYISSYAFYDAKKLVIFTEHLSKPTRWNGAWNASGRPVVWGTSVNIKIEAENFISQQGVQFASTTDTGGGTYAGWLDIGDYLDYAILIPETSFYRLSLRVSSNLAGGQFSILIDNIEKTIVNTEVTGGWQTWQTISSDSFEMNKGASILRIRVNQPGFNLNYFSIIKV